MTNRLETDRLILRRWRDEDRLPFYQINSNPRVMQFFPETLSRTASDGLVDRMERSFEQHGYGYYAAALKKTGRFIGFLGFGDADFPSDFTPCIEIGWRLDDRYWGQGLATEGAQACLSVGFTDFGFHEVLSFTAKINFRSENVMRRIGLKFRQAFDHPKVEPHSVLYRHVLYGLTLDEYRETNPSLSS